MLEMVLESLVHLKVPEKTDVQMILCDNGSLRETKEIVQGFEKRLPFKVIFLKEEATGIVYMRNRILEKAINIGAAFLAFLDDDEEVDQNWLVRLDQVRVKFSAQVVQGNVQQQFPVVPNLDLLTKFFPGSFDKNTGDELNDAYTNNVLFDLSLVRLHGLRFNNRFNLTGGSDSFFFSQLKEKGARIVFAKDAVVTETIPISRANIEWVLFRFYRNGYTKYLMDVQRLGKLVAFRRAIKTVYKAFKECAFNKKTTAMQPQDESILLQKKCLRAKGTFHALMGIPFTEYDVIHGD